MFCEICRKKITSRKHLFNIFRVNTHHICELCYQKYPIIGRESVIPIKGGVIIWQSLIQTFDEVSPLAYMSFYKPYIMNYITHYKNHIMLINDYLDEELIELLDELMLGDIYLLTLYDKIKKKENDYEI